jgi:hypothetical protein
MEAAGDWPISRSDPFGRRRSRCTESGGACNVSLLIFDWLVPSALSVAGWVAAGSAHDQRSGSAQLTPPSRQSAVVSQPAVAARHISRPRGEESAREQRHQWTTAMGRQSELRRLDERRRPQRRRRCSRSLHSLAAATRRDHSFADSSASSQQCQLDPEGNQPPCGEWRLAERRR